MKTNKRACRVGGEGESARGPDSETASRRRRKLLLCLESLEDRTMLSQVFWNNPAGGDWDTASNWSGQHVPTASDDVFIEQPGDITITHSQNTTDSASSITATDPISLASGTLDVAGNLVDSSTVTLSGGTLGGASVQAGTTLAGTGSLSGIALAGTL